MCKVYVSFPEASLYQHAAEIDVNWTVRDLCDHLSKCGLLPFNFAKFTYVTSNGLAVDRNNSLKRNEMYSVHLAVKGGKGGFGSMLRAIGSQIEKTTNNEACRDLSGRRMRDVNNEKKLLEWVKNKADKDKQKEQEKIEKLERQMQRPKHYFNDPDYEKKLEETSDLVEDALKTGLQASKRSNINAKPAKQEPVVKKSKLWLGMDDVTDSSDSGSDDEPSLSVSNTTQKNDTAGPSTSVENLTTAVQNKNEHSTHGPNKTNESENINQLPVSIETNVDSGNTPDIKDST